MDYALCFINLLFVLLVEYYIYDRSNIYTTLYGNVIHHQPSLTSRWNRYILYFITITFADVVLFHYYIRLLHEL